MKDCEIVADCRHGPLKSNRLDSIVPLVTNSTRSGLSSPNRDKQDVKDFD